MADLTGMMQATAGAAGGENLYIEDVFSTYLYTGTGAAQTITTNVAVGNIVAQATTSNTTASSIRAGSTLAGFFASQGIFANYTAGENLSVDFGTAQIVTKVTYKNSVGSDWAPTSVLVQSSTDNTNWTTRTTYSDNATTDLQTITVSGGASARYWRMYQNSNTRANSGGYEWHFGRFSLVAESSDGKGGLVWIKQRSNTQSHFLFDTERGASFEINSNTTDASAEDTSTLTAFTTTGFSLSSATLVNASSSTYASWSFAKAPKFFDVVTWTGDSSSNRTIPHNLGSVPGCIIVKNLTSSTNWSVYHRSLTGSSPAYRSALRFNTTGAELTNETYWSNFPDADNFYIDVSGDPNVNTSGSDYVAYLFAHDAGGFGDDGTENVISCGSAVFSNGVAVDLGWEPQWLLVKNISSTQDRYIIDNMRVWTADGTAGYISPNATTAEQGPANFGLNLTSTGFVANTGSGVTYIYIAIRRGPMKTPESGTEVFAPKVVVGDRTGNHTIDGLGFAPDFVFGSGRGGDVVAYDKLRGANRSINTNDSSAETNDASLGAFLNDGYFIGSNGGRFYDDGTGSITWPFRRAPGFFDIVAYTGNGSAGRTVDHNLGVVPELAIFKQRTTSAYNWVVKTSSYWGTNEYLILEGTNAKLTNNGYIASASSTQITLTGTAGDWNKSSDGIVAYLFASLDGVSKVGTYTGTGTTLAINCGFSAGARLVLIKRTDSTGAWYVWDSARGIVSGNDPYLLLNSNAAEVTNTDYIDPSSAGFEISSTAPAAINASGGNFIFLAIA